MCGGGGKPPPVVQRDPAAEAQKAASESAKKANSETAYRKKIGRNNSLLANGSQGVVTNGTAQSLLATAYGKQTLGS